MIQNFLNKVSYGDCLELLPHLPDNSVDITVTSPPYNMDDGKYVGFDDDSKSEVYQDFIARVLLQLIRVSKYYVFFNIQILSGNKLCYLDLLSRFKHDIKEIIVWHKKQVPPAYNDNCLASGFELVIVFAKKGLAAHRGFEHCTFQDITKKYPVRNVIYGDSAGSFAQQNTADHHATFPLYFAEWFVKNFTNPDEIVLDPFMGTGTTGLACKRLGRNFIGFELVKDYCDYANSRIAAQPVKLSFFGDTIKYDM